jgi:hypothetical protein
MLPEAMAQTSEWVTLVRDLGFPIVMVAWFAFRLERRLETLTVLMTKLSTLNAAYLKAHQQGEDQ